MRKCGVGTTLLALLLLSATDVLAGPLYARSLKTYNGRWWLSVSRHEQYGFLNGYLDCYFFDFKGPFNYWVGFPGGAQDAITSFYKSHPSEQSLEISNVFSRLPAPPRMKAEPTAKVWKGRHVYYDGLYWMQEYALGGVEEQRGFVEGYLWCWENCLDNKGGTFSKSPDEYVSLITDWYQFDPKTGDVNAKRQPAKIADVLYRFRDRKKTPSEPSK